MHEYDDTLQIEQSIFHECKFNEINEDLLKYGLGYRLASFITRAEEDGNEQLAKLYKILRKVCELQLKSGNRPEPYECYGKESISGLLTNNDFQILTEAQNYVSCKAFIARLSDLRWLYQKPKSISDAHTAIELYTSYLISENNWLDSVKYYYERAIRLGLQLGKGCADKLDNIKNNLVSALDYDYQESKFMKLWLAELLELFDQDEGEIRKIAENLTSIAQELIEQDDYCSARPYLEHVSTKYRQIEDDINWLQTRIDIADSWEREASIRNQAFVKMTFFENAIQSYRMIPKADRSTYSIDEKISEIRLKLRDSGKAAIDEMTPTTIKGPDISDIIEASIKHVRGKDNLDLALLYFCGLYSGISKSQSIESAIEASNVGILSHIFGRVQLSGDGRKIGKEAPFMLSDQGVSEDVPITKVVDSAIIDANFVVESLILPSLDTILEEHDITLQKLETICSVCPIIPEQRTKLFAKGLYFGFKHDFASAIHLLVPQWEHMVRTILKDSNVHTTTLDADGIDMECGLSTLLEKKEAEEIFDDNLLFEMTTFLTHKRGPNLRNELAHGLLDDYSVCSSSAIYWWWRSLKLVVNSLVHRIDDKGTDDS
ncbi:DUF4209 domain-containing protein [Photobacterium piscicola]|uniref:DUF4209 domain-containing protein n=1 Tax=Photobacterium piscicola TaxID=1378299 RepID=UPI002E17F8AA|nr:DUF4209 domain-containing protein [Photobacterium piscicola]